MFAANHINDCKESIPAKQRTIKILKGKEMLKRKKIILQ